MKRVVCFLLTLVLVLGSAVTVFADNGNGYDENGYGYENGEADNGDENNGYDNGEAENGGEENGYENGDDDDTDANGEANENGDEADDNGDDDEADNGDEAAELVAGEVWTFGQGERVTYQGENGWFLFYVADGELNESVDNSYYSYWYETGWGFPFVDAPIWMPSTLETRNWWMQDNGEGRVQIYEGLGAAIGWRAPADGDFAVTAQIWGGVHPDGLYHGYDVDGVTVTVVHNDELLFEEVFADAANNEAEVTELDKVLALTEGDFLIFVVDPNEIAAWDVVYIQVTVTQLVEADEDNGDDDANGYDEDENGDDANGDDEDDDEVAVWPLDTVDIRLVDGVEFVRFRDVAAAFDLLDYLSWDAANRTVRIELLYATIEFTIGEYDSFIENNFTYVPLSFVEGIFGGK